MREYIWLPEAEIAPTAASRAQIDRPIAVVDGVNATPATYYVHTDHLHRPIRLSNAAKAFVWSAEYQPWGAVQSLSGALTLDLRFPGQWFQLEAGLHYNWHRHYDATLGRYTQPDPLGFVDGPSVFGYAGGSPLRWADRDGRVAGVDDVIIGGGLVVVTGFVVNYYVNWINQKWHKKPRPAPYCPPRAVPETCPQNEHDQRQDEINLSCKPKPPRCAGPDARRGAQARYCAMLRQEQISQCFANSGGDENHRNEVADWWKIYASCR